VSGPALGPTQPPILYVFMVWCLVKHRDNFTFTFTNNYHDGQVKENEMGETCNTDWGMRNSYKILFGEREGKKPYGRPRHRCEDNMY
jgi:hypothetical protein